MDNLIRFDLDESLTPAAYIASTYWEEGAKKKSVVTLADLLKESFGIDVLAAQDRLLHLSETSQRGLFHVLFSEPLILAMAPAQVAAALWRQTPRDSMLRAILLGDFRWSEDPFDTEVESVPRAQDLIDLLRLHERIGLLSRDTADVPFGGRPVLHQELLAAADQHKLLGIYDSLSSPVVDARPVADWWRSAAEQAPAFVLRTFIHDAFVREDGRPGDPALFWRIIRHQQPEYAAAVSTSWTALEGGVSPNEWQRAARFVARTPMQSLATVLFNVLHD